MEEYGYHKSEIKKGVLGEVSKIVEEVDELLDAHEQGNTLMALLELSDLIGAIKAYASNYNISLTDLINMMEATERAFKSGRRK